MPKEHNEDLLIFEATEMEAEHNVYNTDELSKALPFSYYREELSLSPSPLSNIYYSKPYKFSKLTRRGHRNYTQEDVVVVLKAHFYEGPYADEAGAIIGMPKATAAKLIRTYRPQMLPPLPWPQSQPRAPCQSSMISKTDNNVLAATLQQYLFYYQ
ncbi:hypothetical protein BDC45DRAFT_566622 [Circinella umbellata]|nr:hypothetical protein BDC45DRAFT_566622 [Circinella umbellata]